jgi:hypothetical protein
MVRWACLYIHTGCSDGVTGWRAAEVGTLRVGRHFHATARADG